MSEKLTNLNELESMTKVEPQPNSISPQENSPSSAAAAANWIKNAIQSPHSQSKSPSDPFGDFDSTKNAYLEFSPTTLPPSNRSRLQTVSGSSALRNKLLHRSFSNKLLSEDKQETESSSKVDPNFSKKNGSRSTFSLLRATESFSSLVSTNSSIQSNDSPHSATYTSDICEKTMFPKIQPPFQAWQVTEICGSLSILHQTMEQILLFLENLPKEVNSITSLREISLSTIKQDSETMECHQAIKLEEKDGTSFLVSQLKFLLHNVSSEFSSESISNLHEDGFNNPLKDVDSPIFHFMLTYRYAIHPCELLKTLIHAFDLHHYSLDTQTRCAFQKNIEKCIHTWLRYFFDDFEICPCLLATFRCFLNDLEDKVKIAPEYNRLYCKLASLLEAKTKTDSSLMQRLLLGTQTAKSIVNLESEDPFHLVSYLHNGSMAHVFHVSIPIIDALIRCSPLPHFRILSNAKNYFNHITSMYTWVLRRIEACTSTKARTSLVKKFLKTCTELRNLKDFNACFALLSALKHPWVLQQKLGLKRKYVVMFQELLTLSNPKDDFSAYFLELEMQEEKNSVAIPYLVLHLQLSATLLKKPDTQETSEQWFFYLKSLGNCKLKLYDAYRLGNLPLPEPFPKLNLPEFNGRLAFQKDTKFEKSLESSFSRSLSFNRLSKASSSSNFDLSHS